MMQRTLWYRWATLAVAVGVIVLSAGCKGPARPTQTTPTPGSIVTAADLPIELTYPQSDDQGHYVGLKKDGSYVVSGIVASPQPPRRVLVNGISTVPYGIEQITPYGMSTTYPVYRFHAPVLLAPTDTIVVQVVEPIVSRQIIFTPNGPAVITHYTTLVHTYPSDPFYSMRLGSAYYAQNAFTDSIVHLDHALSGHQDFPWVLYHLGMSYLSLRRADRALDYFNRAIVVYPAFPDLYYGRGMVYYTSRRYDDAILSLVRATDIAPNWAEPLLALGLSYYVDRRLSDAYRVYDRAIVVWPYWPAPRYAMSYVLIDQGRLPDALILIDEGERLGPWRTEHHLSLAEKLFAKGNTNAAWRQVQIARKFGGKVPDRFLARLRSKSKDPGDLKGEPWKGMRGPGEKPRIEKKGRPEGGPGKEAGEKDRGKGPGKEQPGRIDKGKPGEKRGPDKADKGKGRGGEDKAGPRKGGGGGKDKGGGQAKAKGGQGGGGQAKDKGGQGQDHKDHGGGKH